MPPARRAAWLGLVVLAAGCSAPPARTIEYRLVDPDDRGLWEGVPVERLALSLVVCSGRVVHESDPARGGLRVELPAALQRAGTPLPIVFQPEMQLAPQSAVLYQARAQDSSSPWSLALDGQALRTVTAPPYQLSGPGWLSELTLTLVDGPDGPRIELRDEPAGRTLNLRQAGYLWIGPRVGWERHATGTLVAISLRKRPG